MVGYLSLNTLNCIYVQLLSFVNIVTQTLGCRPIASLDHFVAEHLGSAQLVEEVPMGSSKVVKVCYTSVVIGGLVESFCTC